MRVYISLNQNQCMASKSVWGNDLWSESNDHTLLTFSGGHAQEVMIDGAYKAEHWEEDSVIVSHSQLESSHPHSNCSTLFSLVQSHHIHGLLRDGLSKRRGHRKFSLYSPSFSWVGGSVRFVWLGCLIICHFLGIFNRNVEVKEKLRRC